MNKKKIIPLLRFPEFLNEGEWKESTLGDVADNFMYGMNASSIKYDGENKYIRITDIDEDSRRFIPSPLTSPDGQLDEKYLLKKGDILFARTGASVGKTYIHNIEIGKVYFAGFLIRMSIIKDLPYFVYIQTLTTHYQKWVRMTSIRSGQPGINAEEYRLYKITFPPSLPEQQKIADCLSSLDEVIEGEKQRLEQLKLHKKALLQNLFPQQGEKVPKLRFPEFADSGEWEETTIEKIAKVTTGNKDTQNKSINGKYPFFVRSQTVERIDSFTFDGEAILTSGDGVGVGKNFHYINGKFDFHQRVYCIYDFNQEVSGKYIYLYFSQYFNERVMKMSAKNSVDSVRRAMITEMTIQLPKKKEQERIASCLSSLDDTIQTQTERIEQLKKHKKGLLQNLFPRMRG